MGDNQKAAYRYLIYYAMLHIRNECLARGTLSADNSRWRRPNGQSRIAGALADWLHNLALYSSLDFNGFNEQYFWEEHARYCSQFPGAHLERYRDIYNTQLNDTLDTDIIT